MAWDGGGTDAGEKGIAGLGMGIETEAGPWDISCLTDSSLIGSAEVVGVVSGMVETEGSHLSFRAFKAAKETVRRGI